jgi:hypothetical protein
MMQVIGVTPQHLISVVEHNSLLGHLHKIGHMQDSYNICGHFSYSCRLVNDRALQPITCHLDDSS